MNWAEFIKYYVLNPGEEPEGFCDGILFNDAVNWANSKIKTGEQMLNILTDNDISLIDRTNKANSIMNEYDMLYGGDADDLAEYGINNEYNYEKLIEYAKGIKEDGKQLMKALEKNVRE